MMCEQFIQKFVFDSGPLMDFALQLLRALSWLASEHVVAPCPVLFRCAINFYRIDVVSFSTLYTSSFLQRGFYESIEFKMMECSCKLFILIGLRRCEHIIIPKRTVLVVKSIQCIVLCCEESISMTLLANK
jgi:hypothetical protein